MLDRSIAIGVILAAAAGFASPAAAAHARGAHKQDGFPAHARVVQKPKFVGYSGLYAQATGSSFARSSSDGSFGGHGYFYPGDY
jgi:hypothetical protein